MTRPITGALGAYLAGAEAVVADCLMVVRRDGTRVGFTTIDGTIVADIGAGDESYDAGMVVTALTLAVGLDASSAEFRGPIGPVVTRAALLGGAWADAEAWLFRASPEEEGIGPLLHGKIREAREEGEEFVLQLRGEADALNQVIGEVTTPYCRYEYGDSDCGATVLSVDATVSAVVDEMRFTIATADSYADGFFDLGRIEFVTGALAGSSNIDVVRYAVGGAVETFEPMQFAPAIGDALIISQGCAGTRAACMAYNNMIRFGGEPDLPGTKDALKYQAPGVSGG